MTRNYFLHFPYCKQMQISHEDIHYIADEALFEVNKKLPNGIQIKAYIGFITDNFRDYQKDIIEEFIGDFSENASAEHYDIDQVKAAFEKWLESLNDKLKAFADKMDTVPSFVLKGFVQVIVDNVLMTSMIGNVSLMIFRNAKLYYSLHNTTASEGKIDIFSDFIEGDVESHDEIVYVWTKVSDVLDDVDMQSLEVSLTSESGTLLGAVSSLLNSRIDNEHVSFVVHHTIKGSSTRVTSKKSRFEMPKITSARLFKYKTMFLANKYYVSVGILSLLILFLFYHVLSQMVNFTQTDVMFTDEWVLVDVTIDDIKKDIQVFLSMDPTSDAKWQKYHETMQKLQVLEERWRWLEDVAQLKAIIQKNYYEWFNIVYMNDLSAFGDAGSSAQVFTFNNAERTALGDLLDINFTNNLMVAGTKGALIWVLNNSVRWSLIDFALTTPIIGCSSNLLRNGSYCYTSESIYNVTNGGIETLTTSDENWFPADIDAVGVYGKANMYVFQKWFAGGGTWASFVQRYRNTLGSQTLYQEWQENGVLLSSMANPPSFADGFSSYAIDGSFIARSKTDAKLYQFWREWASTLLSVREIPLQWWDKVRSSYSNNVIVSASLTSRYVYLLDVENQTFTAYDSSPIKDGDPFRRDFVLRYLFRFQFDLPAEKVVDFVVPEAGWNKPELYLLTTNGIYKAKLYDFIESLAAWALKQVGN